MTSHQLDYEYEVPVKIGATTFAFVRGTAVLEHDPGYDFTIQGLSIKAEQVNEEDLDLLKAAKDNPLAEQLRQQIEAELLAPYSDAQEAFAEWIGEELAYA